MQGCFTNCSNKVWIFWSSTLNCNVYASEDQMVTCKISDNHRSIVYYLSVVYAKSRSARREDIWGYMRAFASPSNSPWAVCGDFNSILSAEEKLGGKAHRLSKSIPFMECLLDCGLNDIGYSGILGVMKERNRTQDDCFSNTNVQHLSKISSDHCPLLIRIGDNQNDHIKYFKF